eukprot:TRINITY_DN22_c0_g1_i1.p1 TRINITY_DN22_c0_g1~~TRINITY_DN22_c0_g1_i1.p1  ORF type:complete len:519 (+),score=137.64 TRINITY_DN22_c0_g1_i1:32-1588(+)
MKSLLVVLAFLSVAFSQTYLAVDVFGSDSTCDAASLEVQSVVRLDSCVPAGYANGTYTRYANVSLVTFPNGTFAIETICSDSACTVDCVAGDTIPIGNCSAVQGQYVVATNSSTIPPPTLVGLQYAIYADGTCGEVLTATYVPRCWENEILNSCNANSAKLTRCGVNDTTCQNCTGSVVTLELGSCLAPDNVTISCNYVNPTASPVPATPSPPPVPTPLPFNVTATNEPTATLGANSTAYPNPTPTFGPPPSEFLLMYVYFYAENDTCLDNTTLDPNQALVVGLDTCQFGAGGSSSFFSRVDNTSFAIFECTDNTCGTCNITNVLTYGNCSGTDPGVGLYPLDVESFLPPIGNFFNDSIVISTYNYDGCGGAAVRVQYSDANCFAGTRTTCNQTGIYAVEFCEDAYCFKNCTKVNPQLLSNYGCSGFQSITCSNYVTPSPVPTETPATTGQVSTSTGAATSTSGSTTTTGMATTTGAATSTGAATTTTGGSSSTSSTSDATHIVLFSWFALLLVAFSL